MKNKLLTCLPALAMMLALFGCATVSQDQLTAQANAVGYGAEPAPDWQDKIKSFMELRLKDPASAQYKFGTPVKGWITKAPIQGGGLDTTGYLVDAMINARNSYGGYTGFQSYKFLLHDNRVVAYIAFQNGIGFWEHVQ